MPISRYAFEEAQENLRRNPRSRWPDGRRDGSRLHGVVSVDTHATFSLTRGEPIFTVGSCFARNIERRLAELGFDVVTQALRLEEAGVKDNGILNKYSPPSILNEFRWALEPSASFPDDGLIEGADGAWYDLHVLALANGSARDDILARREAVTALYRRAAECRVVVMTLGLVEAWFDVKTGLYINGAPPAPAARRDPARFELHVLSTREIVQALESIHHLLTRYGHPEFRILITVSPVPFKATFTGRDAISANTYSKSALRAATEEFVLRHDNVDYFPSYEVATLTNRTTAFVGDNIHVAPEVVDVIMDGVLARYAPDLIKTAGRLDAAEAKALVFRARESAERGEFSKAAKALGPLASDDQWRLADIDEFEFRYLYGQALHNAGAVVKGETQLRRAFGLDPQSAPVCFLLGAGRRRLGHHAEAEDYLRRAVKLDPKRRLYRIHLAILMMHLGRHLEAQRQLNALLAETPGDKEAVALRAECLDALDRLNAKAEAVSASEG